MSKKHSLKEVFRKQDKGILREQMVEAGFYNRPSGQVHTPKTAYKRKEKYKRDYLKED